MAEGEGGSWEDLLDADTTKVGDKFAEEDNPVHLDQPVIVEANKSNKPNAEKQAKKAKQNELEKKFEEKKQVYEDAFKQVPKTLTAEERRKMEQLSKESDSRNTVDLFSDIIRQNALNTKDEEAYIENAKKVVEVLLMEDRKLYIQEFVKEILQGLYAKLTSKEYQEIYNKALVLLNNKQKEEKPQTGKKKKDKPVLNMTKASISSKNVKYKGDDDEEEYDEEEEYTASTKFNRDDDFM